MERAQTGEEGSWPRFRYRAVDGAGRTVDGELQAPDRAAALARLQALGHLPVRVDALETAPGKEAHSPRGRWGWRGRGPGVGTPGGERPSPAVGPPPGRTPPPPRPPGRWPTARRPGRLDGRGLALLTRELATRVGAGLPLDRALALLRDLSPPAAAAAVERVRGRVQGGSPLGDALEAEGGTFPRLYLGMVRAGEAGGALGPVLGRLADTLERAAELREAVLSALIYPAILAAVAGLSVLLLLVYVVPQFAALFEGAGRELPLATRWVMGAGEALRLGGLPAALALAGAAAWLRRHLAQPARRRAWDARLLRLPLAGGLVVRVETARLARTLGTLLANGVPLLGALGIARETLGNRALAAALETAATGLREGRGLAGPLAAVGLFPALAVQLLRVGEETGELPAMLLRVADIYDREVRSTVQRLLALLEPALIVGMGGAVALVILSILSAVLQINDLAL